MPELPEVETIRRQLKRLIVGRTISSIEVFNPGSFRADADGLIGKRVAAVGRKGKVLIITSSRDPDDHRGRDDLDGSGHDNLYIHLKMSGQLEYKAEGQRPKAKGKKKHLRIAIGFSDGSRLLFHDQRKFGWISADPAVLPSGTDALDPQLTPETLAGILSSSSRPVKQILLDQSKIAGIGNIYASEILWEAKISPLEKGRALPRQGSALLHSIRKILAEAIESGGSTMADGLYQHVGGEAGNYWSRRRVYDRQGELCRRLACAKAGSVIQKSLIGQRSTYFCQSCQSS